MEGSEYFTCDREQTKVNQAQIPSYSFDIVPMVTKAIEDITKEIPT
jgi:hypothetical protein